VVVRVPLSSAAACACASLRGLVHGCGESPMAEVVARITGINRKRDLGFMDGYLNVRGSAAGQCDLNGKKGAAPLHAGVEFHCTMVLIDTPAGCPL
jgi:hypothetical protein